MPVPIILLILSVAGMMASLWHYGPVISDPLLICALSAIAALILLLRASRRVRRRNIVPRRVQRRFTSPRGVQRRHIMVDGSNVMYWNNGQPLIESVRRVLAVLTQRGFTPIVWFDANVGYKIGDQYLGPAPLATLLKISPQQVFVAPKGAPADPFLLDWAKQLKTKVVTNDQFRDWRESHPQVKKRGFLVTGNIRGTNIKLNIGK